MTYQEVNEKHGKVIQFVAEGRINDTLDMMSSLAGYCSNRDFSNMLDQHRETYRNMLKYSFELADDPEKEAVHRRLIKSLLELNDDIREDILLKDRLISYHAAKMDVEGIRYRVRSSSSDLAESLAFNKEVEYILSSEEVEAGTRSLDYQRSLDTIFRMTWLTDKFMDTELEMMGKICRSDMIPWYDKSILVSALTLSLLRHFDIQKVNLLFQFYEQAEMQVWQRALIGLFTGLLYHDIRIPYYPEIADRFEADREERQLEKNIEAIIIQFLKARETEKVTKKIREDILPEMMRMKSTLEEKLNLDDIISAKNIEDENPEWETVFKDTPDLYSKIEEFTNLQMEGSDVFLSAFAMLKRFPFFNELSSWFKPFHRDNEDVREGLAGEGKEFDVDMFLEGLEKSSFLCNSDKYSFSLNVKHMPEMQKSMMMELFNMELKAMNELAESDELIDESLKDKTIFTQYLQDMYRFFKLYPLKAEFQDVFSIGPDIQDSNVFTTLIRDPKILRNIGEFYFQKDYYEKAISVFRQLCTKEESAELHEKAGFSYQKLGDFEKALDHYHKAELLGREKPWLVKKIGWCSRKTGDYDKALKYYQAAERLEPDNLVIPLFTGHVLMDKGDYEGALKAYFKVEYNDPENNRVHRPIAWASFLLAKFEQSEKYLRKIIEGEGNKNDLMNMGHVRWCSGDRKEAIAFYRQSLIKSGRDMEWFSEVMEDDSEHLLRHGIAALDIPLMIDYLRMDF